MFSERSVFLTIAHLISEIEIYEVSEIEFLKFSVLDLKSVTC